VPAQFSCRLAGPNSSSKLLLPDTDKTLPWVAGEQLSARPSAPMARYG